MQKMSITPRRVAFVSMIAVSYAMLTIALAPISYGPVQFRFSEALKALALVQPWAIPGIMVGTFCANLFSPYSGPWELIWMPLTDGLGGLLAWKIGHHSIPLAIAVYALITAASVALMLRIVAGFPFWLIAGSVLLGEVTCISLGWPVTKQLRSWGFLR